MLLETLSTYAIRTCLVSHGNPDPTPGQIPKLGFCPDASANFVRMVPGPPSILKNLSGPPDQFFFFFSPKIVRIGGYVAQNWPASNGYTSRALESLENKSRSWKRYMLAMSTIGLIFIEPTPLGSVTTGSASPGSQIFAFLTIFCPAWDWLPAVRPKIGLFLSGSGQNLLCDCSESYGRRELLNFHLIGVLNYKFKPNCSSRYYCF